MENRKEKLEIFMSNVDSSDEWEEVVSTGMELREEFDKNQWLLGDLSQKVYERWGSQGVEAYAITIFVQKTTLNRYRDVSRRISLELREKYNLLSWSHFRIASGREDPEHALKLASDNNWSVENMANQLKKIDGKIVAPLLKVRIADCQFCRKAMLYGPRDLICANYRDCSDLTTR